MAGNLDAILGIKGGSMSNLLQVVNALQADEDEQIDHRMLRNVAREPFEEVRRDLALPLASGGEVVVPVADPSSLVAASIRGSDTMQAIFMSALKSHPCTLATPWNLLVTWDEFTPGSMHNPSKPKKCMVVNFSFQQNHIYANASGLGSDFQPAFENMYMKMMHVHMSQVWWAKNKNR